MRLSTILKRNERNMISVSKLKLSQSNIKIERTFRAWYLELSDLRNRLVTTSTVAHGSETLWFDESEAKLYYNGGYSPKQAIQSQLRIPANMDLFTC